MKILKFLRILIPIKIFNADSDEYVNFYNPLTWIMYLLITPVFFFYANYSEIKRYYQIEYNLFKKYRK